MDSFKVHPSRNPSGRRPLEDVDDGPFHETMILLEAISDMRIIEKITRPGDRVFK
jgi:hypothetical protein